jgi:hypothetical protein
MSGVRGGGGVKLVCVQCDHDFEHDGGRGRRPRYCSDVCRRAAGKKVSRPHLTQPLGRAGQRVKVLVSDDEMAVVHIRDEVDPGDAPRARAVIYMSESVTAAAAVKLLRRAAARIERGAA